MAWLRPAPIAILAALLASSFSCPTAATEPEAPPDLSPLPHEPNDFVPKRTSWGDPDLRGTWPSEAVFDAGISLERPRRFEGRAWLTQEEFDERLAKAKQSDSSYANELGNGGTTGLAEWLQSTTFGWRTSLIVSPADGRLPPLTPYGETLRRKGRSSWKEEQAFNWLSDFDSFDRCITRGFPASMLPNPYNTGVRIFQAPGFVLMQLEVFGTRIIPLERPGPSPSSVRSWLGDSRGRWEGNTLVIETTNLAFGDSFTQDMTRRSAPPVTGRTNATIPVGENARTLERLTMTSPDRIVYEVTYSDPAVFTAPWTASVEWMRNDGYVMYEYACHEGNSTIRHLIETSRAEKQSTREVGGEKAD